MATQVLGNKEIYNIFRCIGKSIPFTLCLHFHCHDQQLIMSISKQHRFISTIL